MSSQRTMCGQFSRKHSLWMCLCTHERKGFLVGSTWAHMITSTHWHSLCQTPPPTNLTQKCETPEYCSFLVFWHLNWCSFQITRPSLCKNDSTVFLFLLMQLSEYLTIFFYLSFRFVCIVFSFFFFTCLWGPPFFFFSFRCVFHCLLVFFSLSSKDTFVQPWAIWYYFSVLFQKLVFETEKKQTSFLWY